MKCWTLAVIMANLLLCGVSTGLSGEEHSKTLEERREIAAGRDARAPTVVELYDKAAVDGAVVTLGRIAGISGDDERLIEKLKAIELGPVPLPGYTRTLDVDYLKIRLRQNDIQPDCISFQGTQTTVFVRSVEITPEQLLNQAKKYILENIPLNRGRSSLGKADDISIEGAGKLSKVVVPHGEVSFHSSLEQMGTGRFETCPYNSIAVPITIMVDGKAYKTLTIPVKLRIFGDVVVAIKRISRYALVGEADVQMERREISRLAGGFLTSKDSALRKRARREISPGEVLTNYIIEDVPIVNRGDLVMILVESPYLKITALGKAEAEGHREEIIRVMNLSSKKSVYARVVNRKLVRVDFIQ